MIEMYQQLGRCGVGLMLAACSSFAASPASVGSCLSPTAMVATRDGASLFIACATAHCVLRFEKAGGRVVDCAEVPESPSGLALSADERELFVTCAAAPSEVRVLEVGQTAGLRDVSAARPVLRAGHTAMAPVVSPDGRSLYISTGSTTT